MPVRIDAQSFIKDVSVKLDEKSIIRTIDSDNWLISISDANVASFVWANEFSSMVDLLTLPYIENGYYVISDFEILNDTAYFCGYKKEGSDTEVGIWGYINLAGFSSSDVRYCEFPPSRRFDKLDLYEDEGRPHIAMIGVSDNTEEFPIIVEVTETGPDSWLFRLLDYSLFQKLSWFFFDDVTVTDDYVIASSRNTFDNHASVHLFPKPSSYSSFLAGNNIVVSLGIYPIGPVLLEYLSSNFFSFLAELDSGDFSVGFYDSTDWVSEYVLASNPYQCRDIKAKSGGLSGADVLLTKYGEDGNYWSEIITFIPIFAAEDKPFSVDVHKYDKHNIHSMDFISEQDNLIASGISETWGALTLYRCSRHEWTCEEKILTFVSKVVHGEKLQYYEMMPMITEMTAEPMTCSIEESIINTVCE